MTKNVRAVEGDNSKLKVPGDHHEAVAFVWQRLLKLRADRSWAAADMTALTREAKAAGVSGGQIRAAVRLATMTPEERQRWKDELSSAASLYGYVVEDADDMPDRAGPLWGFAERARNIREQKRIIAGDLKELRAVSNEAGINFKALTELAGFHSRHERDEEFDPSEYWDTVDSLGRTVGLWA